MDDSTTKVCSKCKTIKPMSEFGKHKYCKDEYHIDHLIPLARGGHNWPSNVVISCHKCNLPKNDQTPDEFAGRLL